MKNEFYFSLWRRRAAIGFLGAALMVGAMGCGANNSGGVQVAMRDYQFAPQTYQARVGEKVRLVVKNDDAAAHTFTISELGVNQNIPARQQAVIEFQPSAAGVYQYVCLPHPNMRGTLVVKP